MCLTILAFSFFFPFSIKNFSFSPLHSNSHNFVIIHSIQLFPPTMSKRSQFRCSSICRFFNSYENLNNVQLSSRIVDHSESSNKSREGMNAFSTVGPSNGNDLSNLFQARNLAAATRNFPEIHTKDGTLIDPMKPNFLMMVCHEMDRNLLRKLKDTQLPIHYINYKDSNGLTPLGFLCFKGDFILVKMLSDLKGLDVNAEDSEGNTPLMLASQGGHSSVVSFLLERFKDEIDINRRNAFGFTATMKAALQGRVKCLRSLLMAGANVGLRDPNKGYTALDWAEFCGRKSCADEIRVYLKQNNSKSSRRLSQAFSDTENWFKSKLGSSGGSPTSPTKDLTSSLLASASATSTFCASLPLLPPTHPLSGKSGSGDDNNLDPSRRPFIVPTIHVTPE